MAFAGCIQAGQPGKGSVTNSSQDCQRVGWEQKQHKKDCRLVRDRDVSGLFQLQWNKFSDWMSFPLEG